MGFLRQSGDHEVVGLADPGGEGSVGGTSVKAHGAPVDGAHVGCALEAWVFRTKVVEFFRREFQGHSDGFGFVERNDGEHLAGHLEHDVVGPEWRGYFGMR